MLRRLAARAGVRRRFAPHQLRHAHAIELAHEGVPLNVNAMAESFVDSFKTELIADRVWRTRSQLELAIVEYVAWFNSTRLHESLGDLPPAEIEALHAPPDETIHPPSERMSF